MSALDEFNFEYPEGGETGGYIPRNIRITKPSIQNVKRNLKSGFNTLNRVRKLIPDVPQPIVDANEAALNLWNRTPYGQLEEQVPQKILEISNKAGLPNPVGQGLSIAGALLLPGPGEGRVANQAAKSLNRARKLAIKPNVTKNIDLFPPNQDLQPALVGANNNNMMINPTGVVDEVQPLTHLESASDVRPVGHLGGIETLIDEGADSQILKKLNSKYYDQLDSQYQYVTPENLAKDSDTLKLLREREVTINEYFRDYDKMKAQVNVLKNEAAALKKLGDKKGSAAKLKKAKRLQTEVDKTQRELYDFATHNIYSSDMRVYGTDAIRTKLRQKFLEFKGKKWHHIFGNKEAGEYMLSAVAQDPIMTVNLMKHLEKLDLPTSGVARNIAIMEDALHTSWHKYMRKEGYEPTGFIKSLGRMKRAPLDPSDYGKEISKAIIEGKAHPNELFTFLDVYAKYYKEMLNELTTKYQGKVVADMPEGVEKVLMTHRYKTSGGPKVRRGK